MIAPVLEVLNLKNLFDLPKQQYFKDMLSTFENEETKCKGFNCDTLNGQPCIVLIFSDSMEYILAKDILTGAKAHSVRSKLIVEL